MKSLLLLTLFFPPLLWAQQSFVKDGDPLTKWTIDIETSNGKEVQLPSGAIRKLPQCRGDVCYALFAIDPEHGFRMEMASFTLSGQSHFLDPSLIQSLNYVTIRDFSPTEDGGVIVLLHATEKDSPTNKPVPGQTAPAAPAINEAIASHSYLAAYDSTGQLIGVHHLDLQFDPVRMGSLTEQQLLVAGFDKVENKFVLAILGTDGSLVRVLEDQGTLPDAKTLFAGSPVSVDKDAPLPIQQMAMGGALSRMTFGYAGGRVLLLDPGANAAIWTFRGTEVEKTSLKMPKGVIAASIVPSDGTWLVRAFVSATDTGMLLEFDPETGELKRQVDSGSVPATSIFLESDHTFYALWWDARQHSFVVKGS